ncbi:hypothetical protein J6S88_07570 [bacterium]|nr:hypothetical protein [bacterium]
MDKVASVNLQALKEIEPQKEEINFKAKHDNKESDDKGMRKSTKWMIGATILAATTAIGIVTHKRIKAGKAAEELLKDVASQKGRIGMLFNGSGCEGVVAEKLAEIEKLPIEEQKSALDFLEKIQRNVFHLQQDQRLGSKYLRRGLKEYPAEVKKAIDEGRWLDAGELYEKYAQTLPNTFRTSSTGATVEETIKNVFGEGSKIKPHTYDLSQEGEYIMSQRNFGGFHEHMAIKDGIVYEPNYMTDLSDSLGVALYSPQKIKNYVCANVKDGYYIQHGTYGGKYVTILTGPELKGSGISMSLGIASRGKNMSQAQKDLLSLAEHPEKFDASYIDKLTLRNSVNGNGSDHGIVNLDYDLAYSIIQSMARG